MQVGSLCFLNIYHPLFFSVTPNSGTATTDDFDGTVQEVTFQPGETGPKFVEIELVDDNDDEPTENFTVSLSSNFPVNLQRKPSTVKIQDDDGTDFVISLYYIFVYFINVIYDIQVFLKITEIVLFPTLFRVRNYLR